MASSGSVTGIDTWIRNLKQLEQQIHERAEDAVDAALDTHMNVSQPLTPVRTGYLKSRNQTRIVENIAYRYIGEYFNDTPYGPFVAFGTYKMRARDFVTPGFYAGRAVLLDRSGKVL